MSKLPQITFSAVPPDEKLALTRWLDEYALDACLASADESFAGSSSAQAADCKDMEPGEPWAPGQIRLLRPACRHSSHRLVYFLLLRTNGRKSWLAVPFSRYGEPAVPQEWQREAVPPPVRVLCFWNTREVGRTEAHLSWLVDTLPPEELAPATAMLMSVLAGTEPTREVRRNCGPRLTHPLDPRHDYLERERPAMDSLGPMAATPQPTSYPVRNILTQDQLPRAAEDHGDYGGNETERR
ncbi:MAG: hypothetical protein KJ626_03505 [Verrucomicrobia bacterium]|nr:hypothetical protein [Verrucomicrobiota bacterium]